MWSYMSTDYMSENLQHYGVLGMKWGIRRARRSLSRASTKEESKKAISSLESHRGKINKKISKYQTSNVSLQKKSDKELKGKTLKLLSIARKQLINELKQISMNEKLVVVLLLKLVGQKCFLRQINLIVAREF